MKAETLTNLMNVANGHVEDKAEAVEAIARFAKELAAEETRPRRLAGRLLRLFTVMY